MTTRTQLALGVLAAAILPLAACGGDNGDDGAASDPDTVDVTPTETVTLSGDFAPVPDAPAGAEEIGGMAEQIRTPDAATVTITLFGLTPRTDYVAHLHTEPCSAPDPGGPHFKFDADGADTPPNEVHLTFRSDGVGSGAATTEVDRALPDGEALSVVVHQAGPGPEAGADGADEPKLACAEVS